MRTSFSFLLTPEEFAKAIKQNNQRLEQSLPTRWLIKACGIVLSAAATFLLLYTLFLINGNHANVIKPIFVAIVVGIASLLLYTIFYRQGLYRQIRNSNHLTREPSQLLVEDAGLRHLGSYGESLVVWSEISAIEDAGDLVLLFIGTIHFNAIPASAFISKEEKIAFIAYMRARISGATAEDAAIAADATGQSTSLNQLASPATTSSHGVFRTLFANLFRAFRLALFLRVPEDRIAVAWWQIPAFAFLSLILPFLWAFIHVGFDGDFQWLNVPSAFFHLPLILFAGILTAYAIGRSEKSLLLMQVFLTISLVIDVVFFAVLSLEDVIPSQTWSRRFGTIVFYYMPSVWVAAACAVVAVRLVSPKVYRRILAFAVCLILITLPLTTVYRDRGLWEPHYDPDEQAASRFPAVSPGNEDIFYEQPRILQRELAAVEPTRKGVIDVYFIGMAGYAPQDVFMKEVDSVAHLFRERFGSEGRTIRLVNNNKAIANFPIASNTSLRAALKRVSEVMDKEEDILFLFLTSHGSETHRFSLEFWPLKLNFLDPARLRALLDESGITHRVVVISACYSGGFIDALKNENTLVVAASAPDKNSFGCSNEAEWTYFGKAYFDEALRKTYSFTDAFNIAKPVIAEREKKADYNPSEPQIAEGTLIHSKLVKLEQQLRASQQ